MTKSTQICDKQNLERIGWTWLTPNLTALDLFAITLSPLRCDRILLGIRHWVLERVVRLPCYTAFLSLWDEIVQPGNQAALGTVGRQL
ncbi:MAG: hypothetical protein V7K79_12925 [Nostoc sp.]